MNQLISGAAALDALYWRAEILQAMFWLRGEGLASNIEPHQLSTFLGVDNDVVAREMDRLADDGYLQVAGSRYSLTPSGIAEGGRSFQDEFGALTRPAHYECGTGCWCNDPHHVGEPCPNQPQPAPERPEPAPEEEPLDAD